MQTMIVQNDVSDGSFYARTPWKRYPSTCVGYYVHDEWNVIRSMRWTEYGFFRNCKQGQPEKGPSCASLDELRPDWDWVRELRCLALMWKTPNFWARCETQSRSQGAYREAPEEEKPFGTCVSPPKYAPLFCGRSWYGPPQPSWFKTKILRHRTWSNCAHV